MTDPIDTPGDGDVGYQEGRPTGSVPPPPRSNPAIAGTGAAYAPAAALEGEAARRAPTVEEAEALARVAALAVSGKDRAGGPSRAMVATLVALGVLVVALLVLGLIVSVGADPSTTP
jgi:hypothetical protein